MSRTLPGIHVGLAAFLLLIAPPSFAKAQMQEQVEPPLPAESTPATAPDVESSDDSMMGDGPGMMEAPAPLSRDDDDAEGGLLRGPEVPEKVTRTLVRTDAQGRFQRVEGRPEEAAISLLALDPETREAARQAAAGRRESLRVFLVDNLDLVIESTDAQEAKDQEKVREVMRKMRDRFDPEKRRDPVLEPIAAALPTEQRERLGELVDEYWQALTDWELRNAKDKDKSDEARRRIENRVSFELFQQEIRQAYERTLRPHRNKFEAIVRAVEPTEEQKQAIRSILHDFIREGRLEPTPEQQQDAARRIYQALDDERRQKLFEMAFNRL